ncbi:MAG TPA: hypothetical protein VNL15_06490 [Dehalococcoidia bacterium]|nr:hypothetical protein [Dehalococcoidia bacterium]
MGTTVQEQPVKARKVWFGAEYWASKGSLALLDHGLFLGANFLVDIPLARWLPHEKYGAFIIC